MSRRRGVSVIVGAVLLVGIAVAASVLLYLIYFTPSVPNSNTPKILEDLKIVNIVADPISGNVNLSLWNRGSVNISVDSVYVQDLKQNMIWIDTSGGATNIAPDTNASLSFTINPHDKVNQTLLFTVATTRGNLFSQLYVPPSSTTQSNSNPPGGGNSTTLFSISGLKFYDNSTNHNGVYNNSIDFPLDSFAIYLWDNETQNYVVGSPLITNMSGTFEFDGLNKGWYKVEEHIVYANGTYIMPQNFQNHGGTYSADGAWRASISKTQWVFINSQNVTVDFGNYYSRPINSISGTVYDVSSGNGLGGWIVVVKDLSSGLQYFTITNFYGYYIFNNLYAGNYAVDVIMQDGWTNTTNTEYPHISVFNSNLTGYDFSMYYIGGNLTGTYNISGIVYNDLDMNKVYNASIDNPLVNWVVTLQQGSGPLYGTMTDGSGQYVLPANASTTYTVEEAILQGWQNDTASAQTVTVINTNVTDIDFGNYFLGAAVYNITGIVFNDTDGNGNFTLGIDLPLKNWIVTVNDSLGNTYSSITDSSGNYFFGNLSAGLYTVQELKQPLWINSTDISQNVMIKNQSVTVDFGNYRSINYGIGGIVFNDTNANGTYIPSQDPGLPGWVVAVSNGTNLFTGVSNSLGVYSVGNLAPGNYTVTLATQAGYSYSTPLSVNVTITNQSVSQNFGVYNKTTTKSYYLSGFVFFDADSNGSYTNPPDYPYNASSGNLQIQVYASNGTLINTATVNSGTGYWPTFNTTSFYPGTYMVRCYDVFSQYNHTTPENITVTITNSNNNTINFGLWSKSGAKYYYLSGIVFNDTFMNGTYVPANDSGLGGWSIWLYSGIYNGTGNPIATYTTGSNGTFVFPDLASNNYTLVELMHPFYANSTPLMLVVNLKSDTSGMNFGDYYNGSGAQVSNLTGFVFDDFSHNGTWNPSDTNLSGFTLTLLDNLGLPLSSTTSNSTGYFFANLTAGNYTVVLTVNSSWVNSTAKVVNFTVTNQTVIINFGVYVKGSTPTFSIAGMKFNDTDSNGVYNKSVDIPIPNWTILLYSGVYSGSGFPIATTTTNAIGNYSFTGLTAGTYSVVEVVQSGWNTTAYEVVIVVTNATKTPFWEVDFGNHWVGFVLSNGTHIPTYTLSGLKFNDLDHNGIYTPGIEPTLSGWAIYLKNSLGVLIGYTTTNSTGQYTFSSLPNGIYTVYEGFVNGWTNSTANSTQVTIAGSSVVYYFGNYHTSAVYAINGTVFNDKNDNHIYDNPPDTPLKSWTVWLYQGVYSPFSGALPIQTATTTAAGSYTFTNLAPGIYTVIPQIQVGYTNTTVREQVLTIAADTFNVNFGFNQTIVPPTYTISGMKFNDSDHSGTYDNMTDKPIAGWNIFLVDNNGIPVANTVTNSSGIYLFSSIAPGTYTVYEGFVNGWTNSTANSTQVTVVNANLVNISFGNYLKNLPPEYSVYGYVFNDTNSNGVYGGPDTPMPAGEHLTLDIVNKSGVFLVTTTTTTAGGFYIIMDLPQLPVNNTYALICSLNEVGYVNTTLSNFTFNIAGSDIQNNFGWHLPASPYYSISGVVYNDTDKSGTYNASDIPLANEIVTLLSNSSYQSTATDSSGTYTFPTCLNGYTYTVAVIMPNGYTNTTATSYTVTISGSSVTENFGVYPIPPPVYFNISGFVFNDLNEDGTYNAGDTPMPSWIVILNDSLGDLTPVLTDSNGNFTFINVTAGSYTVDVALQANYINSTAASSSFTITNQSKSGIVFGIYKNITVVSGYSISGAVFNDSNKNHIFDANETGLPGWIVTYRDSHGDLIPAITDSNGNYIFPSLTAGTYTITSTSQTGWISTTPMSQNVTITSFNVTGVDFGNFYDRFNVSGYIFFDNNSNGVYDVGIDSPLSGWTANLTAQGGGTVFVTTDASGYFQFTNMPSGNYTLSEVILQGWTNTSPSSVSFNLSSNTNVNFGNVRSFFSGLFTSFTRNEWGVDSQGYIQNNFTDVYSGPNFILIGIGASNYIIFSNTTLMETYLQNSNTAAVLSTHYVNPLTTPGGTFGAEIEALELNVDYSNDGIGTFNPGFSSLTLHSYDPLVNGMTVSQILYMANQVLGGNLAANPWGGSNIAPIESLLQNLNAAFHPGSNLVWAQNHLF